MNQSNETNVKTTETKLNDSENMIPNTSQIPISLAPNTSNQNEQTNDIPNQINNFQQIEDGSSIIKTIEDELNINLNNNKFINTNNSFNETKLENLNVKGNYNIETPDYREDPKVQENLKNMEKKTIPVTKELKMVIVISLILLVFILIIPFIFDLFR